MQTHPIHYAPFADYKFQHSGDAACHPVAIIESSGLVTLQSDAYPDYADESGYLIEGRVCPAYLNRYGNLVVNFTLQDHYGRQAMKISGGHVIPQYRKDVKTMMMGIPQTALKNKRLTVYDYFQAKCSCAAPGPMFCDCYSMVMTKPNICFHLVIRLRCYDCEGGSLLFFPTVPQFEVSECVHNLV